MSYLLAIEKCTGIMSLYSTSLFNSQDNVLSIARISHKYYLDIDKDKDMGNSFGQVLV